MFRVGVEVVCGGGSGWTRVSSVGEAVGLPQGSLPVVFPRTDEEEEEERSPFPLAVPLRHTAAKGAVVRFPFHATYKAEPVLDVRCLPLPLPSPPERKCSVSFCRASLNFLLFFASSSSSAEGELLPLSLLLLSVCG